MSTSTVLVRRIAALFVGVSLAVSLSACGADESPGATSSDGDDSSALEQETAATEATSEPEDASGDLPDPCAWLSPSDLESAVGTTFGDGAINADLSTDFQNICEWSAADGSFLIVQVLVTEDAATVSTQRESAEDFLGETTDVSVEGATAAYTVAGGSILGMAMGDFFVQVAVMSTSTDDVTAQTVALAEIIAANA
ncbi:DUF3558 family protein [Demequina sp.]|uniref:DUF3558 family protein n=1 Tax=Demequina sp. TaxID=2050685 RepID=UPI0025C4DA87|nr:DUF3558 family protein [Demequina sp.]